MRKNDNRASSYLYCNHSSHPLIPRLLFQEVVLLFYVWHFNELLRYFWGVHAVSHDVLSHNGLFRPIYIEEILHWTESVSLSVAKWYRNKALLLKLFHTWKYTKASAQPL